MWAMKQFHDAHIRQASRFRLTDLLEPQLGWWAPRGPSAIARGHFPDELEYFAAQNLAIDGPGSIQGVHAVNRPANARIEELFTVLGWYERLRLARYFDQTTLQQVGQPGHDVRLRQNAAGQWQFTPRIAPDAHQRRWATARSSGRPRTRIPPNRSGTAGSLV